MQKTDCYLLEWVIIVPSTGPPSLLGGIKEVRLGTPVVCKGLGFLSLVISLYFTESYVTDLGPAFPASLVPYLMTTSHGLPLEWFMITIVPTFSHSSSGVSLIALAYY